MSLQKNIQRIERMDELIRFKRTGTPQQFATKMGLSQSMLYYMIKELKNLGAPIIYCKYRESYKYQHPVKFKIGFEAPSLSQHIPPSDMQYINGGRTIAKVLNLKALLAA